MKPIIDAFNNISVTYTRRLGNFVVHSLTKHARHVRVMVLETRSGTKLDLPSVPDISLFLIGLAGFGLFYEIKLVSGSQLNRLDIFGFQNYG